MKDSYDSETQRREKYRKEKLNKLHEEAEPWQESGGYPVDFTTFDFLLTAGIIESQNEPATDNCYIHRLKTIRGYWFKTITEKMHDFNPPF